MKKDVDKTAIYRMNSKSEFSAKKIEQEDDGPGWVEGYAVTWDNIDLGNEVMRKGSFKKSIKERVAARKVKLMSEHYAYGGSLKDLIGTVTEMKEDERGVWFHAEFAKTAHAQEIRQLIADDHVDTCSVGYGMVEWKYSEIDGKEILEHTQCKMHEVTVTPRPMNEEAELTAAKSIDQTVKKINNIADQIDQNPSERDRILSEVGGLEELGKSIDLLNKLLKADEPGTSEDRSHEMKQKAFEIRKRYMEMILEG